MISIKECPICIKSKFRHEIKTIDFTKSKETFSIVSCETCGFLFTNPRPSPENIGEYYDSSSYISHTNNKKGLFNTLYHIIRKHTVKKKRILLEKITTGRNHLDIGCGTGDFLNECKKNEFIVSGVEPSKKAREQARKNFNLKVYDNLFSKELEKEYFDSISMWHVLEHVHDLNATIKKTNALLSNGGKVIVAVPNYNSWDALYYKKYWAAWDLPIHLWHFSKQSITSVFNNNGFKLISTKPMIFDSYYVSLLSEEFKTGRKKFIKSFFIGSISNIKAKLTNKEYSSLIYIFEKI